jgi:hypothetical protein
MTTDRLRCRVDVSVSMVFPSSPLNDLVYDGVVACYLWDRLWAVLYCRMSRCCHPLRQGVDDLQLFFRGSFFVEHLDDVGCAYQLAGCHTLDLFGQRLLLDLADLSGLSLEYPRCGYVELFPYQHIPLAGRDRNRE